MPEKKELSEKETNGEKKATFQTETIKGLVILFYKNLLQHSPIRYMIAYMLARTLAKRFHMQARTNELDSVYKNTTIGYNLGLMQVIVYRDTTIGQTTNKSYNYGFQTKVVKLGDMIIALDESMVKILDIFTTICVEKDVDTTFAMPMLQGMTISESAL